MINNIKLITPFLKFNTEDDFYYLQILQRKKENPEIGSNSRVIKNYYITSEQYLLDRYDEIKKLCEVFNARASIRLNKRSFEKVGMKTMVNLANTMSNKEYKFLKASYDRACGLGHNDSIKKWIIDLDETKESSLSIEDINAYKHFINSCEPLGEKILELIPSKNGYHLITLPFNVQQFKEFGRENVVEIHKDNPTNLYIP